jgi:sulfate adenylyltransferase subunit 2
MGKDSTALLWMMRKAFFGKIPFPAVHIDTSYKFKEIYEFRDKYAKRWGLELIVAKNDQALKLGLPPKTPTTFDCCSSLKTDALKLCLKKYGFQALYLAIRRDEHGIRAKERYVSPRNQDFQWDYRNQPPELWDLYQRAMAEDHHVRIHPMLHWSELDVWKYAQRERIPLPDLYFAKKGKRYRSIGCVPCCLPVDSQADTVAKIIKELESTDVAERSGRAQDKEDSYAMQKLRSLGYM